MKLLTFSVLWALSISMTGLVESSKTQLPIRRSKCLAPIVANFTYLGCFYDPVTPRTLGTSVTTGDSNTVEVCANACATAGYTYSGVEYSTSVDHHIILHHYWAKRAYFLYYSWILACLLSSMLTRCTLGNAFVEIRSIQSEFQNQKVTAVIPALEIPLRYAVDPTGMGMEHFILPIPNSVYALVLTNFCTAASASTRFLTQIRIHNP